MDVLLNSTQLAASLGVSVSTVCRYVARGMPRQRTLGGKNRFRLRNCKEWLRGERLACELAAVAQEGAEDDDAADDGDNEQSAADPDCEECHGADPECGECCAGDDGNDAADGDDEEE